MSARLLSLFLDCAILAPPDDRGALLDLGALLPALAVARCGSPEAATSPAAEDGKVRCRCCPYHLRHPFCVLKGSVRRPNAAALTGLLGPLKQGWA